MQDSAVGRTLTLVDERHQLEIFRAETERLRLQVEQAKAQNDDTRLALDKSRLGLEHYRAEVEARKPLVEGLLRFAELTVRSLLILNGGSAMALLAFAGNAMARGTDGYVKSLAPAVLAFGVGATLSVATAAFSYLAQLFLIEPESERLRWWLGGGMRVVAVLCGLGALIIFVYGIWILSKAFS
jgi:hypothetical protein